MRKTESKPRKLPLEAKLKIALKRWRQGFAVELPLGLRDPQEVFMSEDFNLCVMGYRTRIGGDKEPIDEEVPLPIWAFEGFAEVLRMLDDMPDEEFHIMAANSALQEINSKDR